MVNKYQQLFYKLYKGHVKYQVQIPLLYFFTIINAKATWRFFWIILLLMNTFLMNNLEVQNPYIKIPFRKEHSIVFKDESKF